MKQGAIMPTHTPSALASTKDNKETKHAVIPDMASKVGDLAYPSALMCSQTYNAAGGNAPHGWKKIATHYPGPYLIADIGGGWGIGIVAYANEKTKQLIIAFRGTENLGNVISDTFLAARQLPLAQDQAENFVTGLIEKYAPVQQFLAVLGQHFDGYILLELIKWTCLGVKNGINISKEDTAFKLGKHTKEHNALKKHLRDLLTKKELDLKHQTLLETVIKNIRKSLPDFDITFTGHSLGAVMAELCACRFNMVAITYESPGCRPLVIDNPPYTRESYQHIQTFLAAPNAINSLHEHIGKIAQVYIPHAEDDYSFQHVATSIMVSASRIASYLSFPIESLWGILFPAFCMGYSINEDILWTKNQHSIDSIIEHAFDAKTGDFVRVTHMASWPTYFSDAPSSLDKTWAVLKFVLDKTLGQLIPFRADTPGLWTLWTGRKAMLEAQLKGIPGYQEAEHQPAYRKRKHETSMTTDMGQPSSDARQQSQKKIKTDSSAAATAGNENDNKSSTSKTEFNANQELERQQQFAGQIVTTRLYRELIGGLQPDHVVQFERNDNAFLQSDERQIILVYEAWKRGMTYEEIRDVEKLGCDALKFKNGIVILPEIDPRRGAQSIKGQIEVILKKYKNLLKPIYICFNKGGNHYTTLVIVPCSEDRAYYRYIDPLKNNRGQCVGLEPAEGKAIASALRSYFSKDVRLLSRIHYRKQQDYLGQHNNECGIHNVFNTLLMLQQEPDANMATLRQHFPDLPGTNPSGNGGIDPHDTEYYLRPSYSNLFQLILTNVSMDAKAVTDQKHQDLKPSSNTLTMSTHSAAGLIVKSGSPVFGAHAIANSSSGNSQTLNPQQASSPAINQAEKRTPLKADKIGMPTLIKILNNKPFMIGKAHDNNDCFFDAIAQALHGVAGISPQNAKSLRMLCHQHANDSKNETFKNWFTDIDGSKDYEEYKKQIQYTQPELAKKGLALWGEAARDGKILCENFKINLHVINIADDESVTHQLISSSNIEPISSGRVDYKNPNIIHVACYKRHFVPILPKSLQQQPDFKNMNLDKALRARLVSS